MSNDVANSNNATEISATLGRSFIAIKLAGYVEPVRKGASRGTSTGMKRDKFIVALLLAVYNLTSAEVAMVTGTPVRLISKWRTESVFSTISNQLCSEFFVDVVAAYGKEAGEILFQDCRMYSRKMKELLMNECDRMASEQSPELFRLWPLVRCFF